MELRELLMAETTAFGVGVDPARITLAAGRLLSGASCDRDEQVTVPQPWKWNGPPEAVQRGAKQLVGRFRKSFHKYRSETLVRR